MKELLNYLVDFILQSPNNEFLTKATISKRLNKNKKYISDLCTKGASDETLESVMGDIATLYLTRNDFLKFILSLNLKLIILEKRFEISVLYGKKSDDTVFHLNNRIESLERECDKSRVELQKSVRKNSELFLFLLVSWGLTAIFIIFLALEYIDSLF